MASDNLVLGVLGVIALVVVGGLFALALSKQNAGGTIAVLDANGTPLYTIVDRPGGTQPAIFRQAPFVPIGP